MNGNSVVLDANIVLYLFSGDVTLGKFLQGKNGFLSIVTELELIGYPQITAQELSDLKIFIESCSVIELNDEIKAIYTPIRRKYKLKLGDAAAAATAIHLDLPFMSADNDFKKVTELNFAFYSR